MKRLVAAVAVPILAATFAACAGRPAFDDSSIDDTTFGDVEQVLAADDLSVCSTRHDPEGLANQARATRTYVVAFDCAGDDTVRVVVDRFDDVEHRDGAARQFESLLRPRGDGAVWAWGPFTLYANGARDDDVMERLSDALNAAGAQ